MKKIQEICDLLSGQKALKDWDMSIDPTPIGIKSQVLEAPKIFSKNQVIHCDESILRKLPILEPKHLKDDKWIMIYQRGKKNKGGEYNQRFDKYEIADGIYNELVKAADQLKIVVEEPYWIEM